MSTPPSGGEGHNPYGQQPSNQPDHRPADPYRPQPNPPYPYGQGGAGSGSGGQSPYGEARPATPPPSQPPYGSQPSYGSSPGYGAPAPQPSYGEPAQPTQQFGAPAYGQQQPSYGQPGYVQPPAYGQQPYGQYGGQPDWAGAPGPTKKSKTPLIAGIVGLLVLLAVALLLILPGSPIGLGGKVFDGDAVAEDIAQQYEDEFGLQIDVTCPPEQEVVSGESFSCDGETEEGDTVELDVEITSDDGDYTWSEA